MIDKTLLARLAELSALELEPSELDELTDDLRGIVAYVDVLGEADTSSLGAAPEASPQALRDDVPRASLEQALALREAPRADDGGFVLPAFVDEG